jgi:uncharacterized protein (DUF2267 family)/predicted transcriptional regulator
MVILRPSAHAYEAARAMAENGVGAIVVAEDQHVVGIVTDRDLALEIAAADLPPKSTPLRDVMSDLVVTVDIGDTLDDVVAVMRAQGCRRVPVTEHGRCVGIVSLDDLLLERAVDLETAGTIVRDQLRGAAGALKPPGTTRPELPAQPELATGRASRAVMRRRARAELAYSRLLHAVEARSGLSPREKAERALLVVLGAVCRRVTPDEARHFVAQLPSKLKTDLERVLDGPDRRITRPAIEMELVREVKVAPDVATALVGAVGEAIAASISAGEIEALRGQLPLDLKDLFPSTSLRVA